MIGLMFLLRRIWTLELWVTKAVECFKHRLIGKTSRNMDGRGTNLKWCPLLICSSLLPSFSSMKFSVAGFMLRFLIHFGLSFIHVDRYVSI